jgi:hypothetical protein
MKDFNPVIIPVKKQFTLEDTPTPESYFSSCEKQEPPIRIPRISPFEQNCEFHEGPFTGSCRHPAPAPGSPLSPFR